MAKDGIQLVSDTHEFKFQAPDGEQRAADALDADSVQTVAKNYPNNSVLKIRKRLGCVSILCIRYLCSLEHIQRMKKFLPYFLL